MLWLVVQDWFWKKIGQEMDVLANEAFARMDRQLDFSIQHIRIILGKNCKLTENDYKDSEFSAIWSELQPHDTLFKESKMYYRTEQEQLQAR